MRLHGTVGAESHVKTSAIRSASDRGGDSTRLCLATISLAPTPRDLLAAAGGPPSSTKRVSSSGSRSASGVGGTLGIDVQSASPAHACFNLIVSRSAVSLATTFCAAVPADTVRRTRTQIARRSSALTLPLLSSSRIRSDPRRSTTSQSGPEPSAEFSIQ